VGEASRGVGVEALARAVQRGERRALAKAITLVESTRADDRALTARLLELLGGAAKATMRVGVSGVPGAGKSTFIDALGALLVEAGHKVAVLSVDPSSARTGGSVLGDKTRMTRLSASPNAFIRPSPSAGALGGIGAHTREAIAVCEAAGHDVVLVETVGSGQLEQTVTGVVDHLLLLLIPAAGDELQGIKRGVLELCDVVGINKCDGPLAPLCETTRAQYQAALSLLRGRHAPPVVCLSARSGSGVREVWDLLEQRHRALGDGGLDARRKAQRLGALDERVDAGLRAAVLERPEVQQELDQARRAVERGQIGPERAAERVLDRIRRGP